MSTVSLQDIERDLVAILKRVEAGESFVVVSGDRPLAELRPVAASNMTPRPFGLAAGEFEVPADFDAPLPDEVLKEFEGT